MPVNGHTNETISRSWIRYVKDTSVSDTTAPPAPSNVHLNGNQLSWEAEVDLESGLAGFIVERDGRFLANVPEHGKNPFGRPIFQNLQYSDTPTQPLVEMQFLATNPETSKNHSPCFALDTVKLKSKPSPSSVVRGSQVPK